MKCTFSSFGGFCFLFLFIVEILDLLLGVLGVLPVLFSG